MLRALRALLIGLAALLVLGAGGIAAALWWTLPPRRATAAIPGLSAPVSVTFDQYDIPRIRAANLADAAAALGYVHARDRMFQMDLMRRVASGRLAAIAGPAALPLDREMRTLGLRRAAEADDAALPAPTRALLAAYARGVSAFIAAHGRFSAPEFLLLGAPKPWTPVDTLLWAKTMGLWLSMNWRQELARFQLAATLPRPVIQALWPPQHEAGAPDAERETGFRAAALSAPGVARALPAFPAPFTEPARASNEWAVDGRRSATGKPLLAGDPHLGFGFPSIWYLARIDTPHHTLVGATAPGVPGVVLGRNRHIAWTFTDTGADVQDIFVETPVGKTEYATPDGPKPFAIRSERIAVRGEPARTIRIRSTRHGPVISDLFAPHGPILAVSMANLQRGHTAAEGLLALDVAGSVAQAQRAAALITSPVQNLLVAGQTHIGLFMTGRVPIRAKGDGSMPVPGASGAYDWVGWASGAQLPEIVDPPSGRLVNANNRVAPPDFPVFLGRHWFSDWRARRIRQLLKRHQRLTVADFVAMQHDVTSLFARALLPRLRAVPPPPGRAGAALRLLDGWNGAMGADAPQPLIFHAWIDRFYELLMRRNHVKLSQAVFAAPPVELLPSVLGPDGGHWCGGDCTPMLRTALEQAVDALAARFGAVPADWRWGQAHRAVFADPLLRSVPLLRRFASFAIASPGSATTIDAGGTALGHFTSVHGPEFRAVYDLADLDDSRFMMAPGQSGSLLSRFAGDFLHAWRDGRTITIGPHAKRVTATLRLVPAGR
ncbi:MAG: penicillin acylase family protein [Rhodospirillales bacterium]|nr:penicillin acylase family protein [Rhodospirillales bacterium]